jgi:hypothetical protein
MDNRNKFTSRFPNSYHIVKGVEELEVKARAKVYTLIEQNYEFLSKTPLQDPSHTLSRKNLFSRTTTIFWVMKGSIALAIMGDGNVTAQPNT